MNTIRSRISQINTISKKEDIFFSVDVLRFISNDNIIMMCDIINSKLHPGVIDRVIESVVEMSCKFWDERLESLDSKLYEHLKLWSDYAKKLE